MARRSMSNQLEMIQQAELRAFHLKNNPCTPHCKDRRCACQIGCEKHREYREKRDEFRAEIIKAVNNERTLNKFEETAKVHNTERT